MSAVTLIEPLDFKRHIDTVMMIEEMSFFEPWMEVDLSAAMQDPNVIVMVATIMDCVVGYIVVNLCYVDKHDQEYVLIERIAVARASQKCGIGRRLIEETFSMLSHQEVNKAIVRVSLQDFTTSEAEHAGRFFKACGMKQISGVHTQFEDTDRYLYKLPGEKTYKNRIKKYCN